jgi:hypothetical protein
VNKRSTLKFAVMGDDNTIRLFPLGFDGTITRDGRTAAPETFKDFVRIAEVPQCEPLDAQPRNGHRSLFAVYRDYEGRDIKYQLRRADGTYWLVTDAGLVRVTGRLGGLAFRRFDGTSGDVQFLRRFFGTIQTAAAT